MATFNESLTVEQSNMAIRICEGLRITHLQRSVGPCLILQIGRLSRETLKLSNRSKPLHMCSGQITCMIESDWRVEKPRSIHFGSGFSDRRIDKLLNSLIDRQIIAIGLLGRVPELRIELDDGRAMSTFTNWASQPRWSIGFKDAKLFNPRPLPLNADISPWIHVRESRLEIEYCYDDGNPDARQFFCQLDRA